MDSETLTWVFLAGGFILMIMELLLPGGVAFFLGISGLGVGVLRWLGILSDPFWSVFWWLSSALGLSILIRPFIKKYLKGDRSFKLADEDYEAIDKVVDVVETVTDYDNSGRIRYQGISWQARTMDGEIRPGQKARISYRENTTWIVEALDPGFMETGVREKEKN
jgi:membrane protein implicated in regulation of membrane protease activity